ncbi:MAG: putative N-acetylmannosamine-6-phosphate 2-epimerase [Jatrophihabitans sp.]|nr:MAG: putative N-acetylmannosamine-6-phosphate 2-epimerase [Jatrophihabitans sp.]
MILAEFRAAVRGRLIVSCQAPAGHALRDTATLVRMARAAVDGGAAAIRCGGVGGVADVAAIRRQVALPVIGLTKDGAEGVYITPTVAAARAVVAAGADVVALDATGRPRPEGAAFADSVAAVHALGALVMADTATLADAVAAVAAGADVVATTLSGYVPGSPAPDGPDLALVAAVRVALPDVVLVAEGRYHHPAQARAAVDAGADSVVVGTAITDPAWITGRFAAALPGAGR